jgi:protoheme IX farnesyltransferase
MVGKPYIIGALLFSLVFLIMAVRFARVLSGISTGESRKLARGLLRASIIYLPLLFALMMINANFTPIL